MIPANENRPDSQLRGTQTPLPPASGGFMADSEDDEHDTLLADMAKNYADLVTPASTAASATTEWKASLRRDFERWLESVDQMPEADEEEIEAAQDAPSLLSFHEQLTSATTEWKRSGRRTADALAQLGESLSALGEETRQLRTQRAQADQGNSLPEDWCLHLIETTDRIHRLQQAFARPPAPVSTWWSTPRKALETWRSTWQTQAEAFAILAAHVDTLLRKAGLERVSTKGRLLDPTSMTAVAVEAQPTLPDQTVLEEVLPGYRREGKVLRAAHVKVSRQS